MYFGIYFVKARERWHKSDTEIRFFCSYQFHAYSDVSILRNSLSILFWLLNVTILIFQLIRGDHWNIPHVGYSSVGEINNWIANVDAIFESTRILIIFFYIFFSLLGLRHFNTREIFQRDPGFLISLHLCATLIHSRWIWIRCKLLCPFPKMNHTSYWTVERICYKHNDLWKQNVLTCKHML